MAMSEASREIVWSEETFKEGLQYAKLYFGVENLFDDQVKALRCFFQGKNIYFSAPTGYGKSLIFQAIPLIADIMRDCLPLSSSILVISPLQSLMLDQVAKLKRIGISAAAIYSGQTEEILKDIEEGGIFSIFLTSPESMLATDRWQRFLKSATFTSNCVGVAFDEAHCIAHWGQSYAQKPAFRKWYWQVGEINSFLDSSVKLAVFTATASRATKATIFSVLNLAPVTTYVIEKSPVKTNLSFFCKYVGNDTKLDAIFSEVIVELKQVGVNAERTMIFCQTRNKCALIWKMFQLSLGKDFYANGCEGDPKCRLVEMFHAGTPQSVKGHVLAEIGKEDSCLRTLVVTTPFGMGVDCKTVRRVIHFGPSKTIEAYIQECGRSGRDNKISKCYLLYNGFLASHCQMCMKQYVTGDSCRRKSIERNFPGIHPVAALGCLCCDVCLAKCQCLAACSSDVLQLSNEKKDPVPSKTRRVTPERKENLQIKLQSLKDTFKQSHIANHGITPTIMMEFTDFHVSQILQCCSQLFNLDDVLNKVETWRMKHAMIILHILNEVFDDIDISDDADITVPPEELYEEEIEDHWRQVRDDSEINTLGSFANSDISQAMEELDRSGTENESLGAVIDYHLIKPHIEEDDEPMEI